MIDLNILESPSNTGKSIPLIKDLLIALRKQTRPCIIHPISKFASDITLSLKFYAFTSNLDKITIPKNIYEAWEIPKWKETVMKELWG